MRSAYLITIAVFCVFCAAWRMSEFGNIDYAVDQAFFTQWIKRLANASRFFPVEEQGARFITSLMKDEGSFLTLFLSQIYQAHALLFTVVSIALYLLVSSIFGASIEAIVSASIIFSVIWLWLIAAFPILVHKTIGIDFAKAASIGLITLFIGCFNSFFNVFSAMGPHNAGVMMMVLSIIITQLWLIRLRGTASPTICSGITVIMFVVQWAAIYTHYTNIFILPLATVIAIASQAGHRMTIRVTLIVQYSIITFVAFIPAIALALIYDNVIGGGVNTQTFGGLASAFVLTSPSELGNTATERFVMWFNFTSFFYSAGGLALGVIGVLGLAWRYRLTMPATVVFAHFLAGVFLQIFTQYDRTAAYLLPLLMLGGGWCLSSSTAWMLQTTERGTIRVVPVAAAVVSGCILLFHFSLEIPGLRSPELVHPWGRIANHSGMKKAIADLDKIVPEGSTLMSWDYATTHQFRATTKRQLGTLLVTRPIETLVKQKKLGSLSAYIETRGLSLTSKGPLFVLAPIKISKMKIKDSLSDVLGTHGFGGQPPADIAEQRRWKFKNGKYHTNELVLYLVRW